MSAHDPKASMFGCITVSTPMVKNPNERPVNIAAAGLAQIEAIMATGKGFEEAYAEAWRREVGPRKALSEDRERAPSPPRDEQLSKEFTEKRKDCVCEALKNGELFLGDLLKVVRCGKSVMLRIVDELQDEGRIVSRKSGQFTRFRLAGMAPNIGESLHPSSTAVVWNGKHYSSISACTRAEGITHNTVAKALRKQDAPAKVAAPRRQSKACTIDGIDFVSYAAAAVHFNVSCHIAGKYAKRGTSVEPVRVASPRYKKRAKGVGEASRQPCTIDGVTYVSHLAARIALKVSKGVIRRWAIAGTSSEAPRIIPSSKPVTIDGITFPTQTAAAAHFNVAYQTAVRYAERGTSAAPVRVVVPKPPRVRPALGEASRQPCTIDGVTYESKLAARIALKVGKDTISRWAIDGKSAPVRRGRHATAAQAARATNTRKTPQTPSQRANSQPVTQSEARA